MAKRHGFLKHKCLSVLNRTQNMHIVCMQFLEILETNCFQFSNFRKAVLGHGCSFDFRRQEKRRFEGVQPDPDISLRCISIYSLVAA